MIGRAIDFVQRHGDERELARLRVLIAGPPAPDAVVGQLLAGQRGDGGWAPFWAPQASGLDATCYRLAQAEQLGLDPTTDALARALDFLAGHQRDDGTWEEQADLADLAPPWARPGDLAARLYLTACCGFWLARWDTYSLLAARAAAHLAGYDARLPSFLHTQWLAAALWWRLGLPEPAARALRVIEPQLDRLPASSLAWLIACLRSAGVPGDDDLVRRAAVLLAHQQQEDGRWVSEDDPMRDVDTTIAALRALQLVPATGLPPPV